MKKILMVIHSLEVGGAEKNFAQLANFYAERGFDVTVVAWDDRAGYSLRPNIKFVVVSLKTGASGLIRGVLNNLQRVRKMRQVLKAQRPDIVISFMDTTNVICALAARAVPTQVVVCERSDPFFSPQSKIWRAARPFAYKRADRIVVQSQYARTFFSRTYRERVAIIPNSISVSEPLAPAGGEDLVCAVGRLHPEKGFDLLIQAFAKLRPEFPTWSLKILGEGDDRQRLENLIAHLGLKQSVSLPGRREDPWADVTGADLFVMSSQYEGCPNALLEAMGRGFAVISSDTGGCREIVRHEMNGLTFKRNDVPDLAKQLKRLMADEDERRRFGARARGVLEEFSPSRIEELWLNLVASI